MHWGSFKLSNEPMEEPIARFRQVAAGQMEKVAIQEVGHKTWFVPDAQTKFHFYCRFYLGGLCDN
jgi:hypothetical protein